MGQNYQRILDKGLGLAAVSYDNVGVLKAFADREHLRFPMLSDATSEVIRRYGILNDTVDTKSPFYGIPYPGTYVLDAKGVVVAKYFEDDYKVRDTAASILLRQFGLTPAAHHSIAGKHINLSLAGPDGPVRPNQRVTLSIDVELPKRVHVYAPGVKGYIPIGFTLNSSTAYRAEPVVYPPSKVMELKAIHESVPVYAGRFRVTQTTTLAPDVEKMLESSRAFAEVVTCCSVPAPLDSLRNRLRAERRTGTESFRRRATRQETNSCRAGEVNRLATPRSNPRSQRSEPPGLFRTAAARRVLGDNRNPLYCPVKQECRAIRGRPCHPDLLNNGAAGHRQRRHSATQAASNHVGSGFTDLDRFAETCKPA